MKNKELETEKNPIKFRLYEFFEKKDINSAQFERKCGLAEGFVSKIQKSMRSDMLKKITIAYPELNISWLLTGVGRMILEKNMVNDDPPPYGQELYKAQGKIEVLEKELEEAKHKLEEANRHIGRIETSCCPEEGKKKNYVA